MKNALVPVLVLIIAILVVALFLVARKGAGQEPVVPAAAPTQAQPAARTIPTELPTVAASSPTRRANQARTPYLPDARLTPGDALDVSKNDVCQPGYSSKVRDVPESVKNEVYREYGITSHQPGEYEVDHLISLELGGSNSVKNLWPEKYTGPWNAHEKDKLEDRLHAQVCSGAIDLKTAQREISDDWTATYVKYFGQPKQ